MEFTDSKIVAQVSFLAGRPQSRRISGPHEALVHLFEHQYDAKTIFWCGVADITCAMNEVQAEYQSAGFKDQITQIVHDHTNFQIAFIFEDGRMGHGVHLNSKMGSGLQTAEYFSVAFTGITNLAPPRRHGIFG